MLGITLTKHGKNFYAKIQKMLVEEIKDDLSKWRDILVLLLRIDTMKMPVLPKLI